MEQQIGKYEMKMEPLIDVDEASKNGTQAARVTTGARNGKKISTRRDEVKEMATEPINKDEYCEELSGDWSQVPEWVIKRLNFLEGQLVWNDQMRAPLMHEPCPKFRGDPEGELSCLTVKHCYPYLCNGVCGQCNEVWLNDEILHLTIIHWELRCPLPMCKNSGLNIIYSKEM